MTDFALGPLVLSGERMMWIAAVLVLMAGAAIASPKGDGRLNAWAFRASVTGAITARLAFVVLNVSAFAEEPLNILAFWQGGFTPWAGVPGFLAASVVSLPNARDLLPKAAIVTGFAALTLYILLQLFSAGLRVMPDDRAYDLLNGGQTQIEGPAVVNLWAIWCPPCRREMPMMVEEALGSPDLPIHFVNMGENPGVIRRYLDEAGLDMDPLLDPHMQLMTHLGAFAMPTTLFVDAQGRVTHSHSGEISRAALRRGMSDLKR